MDKIRIRKLISNLAKRDYRRMYMNDFFLTWEKTDLYNAALDLAFFNNRLMITAEGYISKTRDLLLTVQTASATGYTSRYANIGKTSNKGVELSIESRNIVRPKFSWTTNLTIAHNKQNVDDIGSEDFVTALSSPGCVRETSSAMFI